MASIFVTHGGGPMPLIYLQEHKAMYEQFAEIAKQFPEPKGIIIFSAHWEENSWTIIDQDNPPLYYDYYGFPKETYNLSYSMSSSQPLRNYVKDKLKEQGVDLKSNKNRGYDHGVFVPMIILYPKSNIPVIQISLVKSLDPELHFRMGQALRVLKRQGFIILGSGASVHGGFGKKESVQQSHIFNLQLGKRIEDAKTDDELLNVATNWRKLKFAAQMHPRQEHLVPLFVNLGAHEGQIFKKQDLFIMGMNFSSYVLS